MTASDCLFCRIGRGQVPAMVVHSTARTVAFRDVAPQAPVHVLVVPRDHHRDLAALVAADPALATELFQAAVEVAHAQGLGNGHRLVVNTGVDGGQTVHHLHVHVLGGRGLGWPPG